jgi:ABC-type nitrate/sulfonate/bicarbonate transport system permease component
MEFWSDFPFYAFTPIILLILASILSVFGTKRGWYWSPSNSDQVNEICEHMTTQEKWKTILRSGSVGLALAGFFGIPLVLGLFTSRLLSDLNVFRLLVALLVPPIFMGLTIWKLRHRIVHNQKAFFASTQWAQEQGLTAADIVLRR